MCGIIGILDNKDAYRIAEAGLKLMNYRGLDGGRVVGFDNGALGHCLHAVVSSVVQPLGENNLFITNCEIYNWRQLMNDYRMQARNDAELFYCLLEKFGAEKTLELVDGDYACAYLIDNKIYLFRDIFGVKPLWYSNEDSFAFASEKKVLEGLGYNHVDDLNPRKILVYNLETKKVRFIDRNFFEIKPEHIESYEEIKNKTKGLLINAIAKRIPDCKFGLLFSGGLDSSFIALVLKQLGVDFNCYTCVLENDKFSQAKDLEYAKMVASSLGLKLNVVKKRLEDVKREIQNVVSAIESSNVTKVVVALPFYFATKKAREDGCKVVLSGLGSEEIFAGYERHKASRLLNRECYSGLLWIYERDLYRDDAITMINNVELRVPFLDRTLVDYALKIPEQFKIKEGVNKLVLRDVAISIGLDKEIAFRKKIACQYGSNFDKAIAKLSRINKCNKSEYLNKLYKKPNVKLGVLFSGGKDSCYAMHVMARQNYSVEFLISMKSKNKDSFMFHTPNIDLVKHQAKALEIPLIFGTTRGEKESELEDLRKVLKKAISKYKIQGVVTGALFSGYQRNRIENICDSLGLKVFSPLWHKTQEQELREIVKEGFEVIISSVAADGLNEKWLGRKIDFDAIRELKVLSEKYGINAAFEGGEAETLVLNAPMFKKRIKIIKAEKKMFDEHSGIYIINKVKLINKLAKD